MKDDTSYARDDLLLLAKVADQAHSRVFQLQPEEQPEPWRGRPRIDARCECRLHGVVLLR